MTVFRQCFPMAERRTLAVRFAFEFASLYPLERRPTSNLDAKARYLL